MTSPIKVFTAKKIITMNPSNPEATAVAVRDGRILGVGAIEDLQAWGGHELDDTFKDKVLLPGFIEAHSHVLDGAVWSFPYVGYFDRYDPNGKHWPGCKSINEVVARLKEAEANMSDPNESLVAWGLDPIYFPGERMTAVHLDQVSQVRPIFILHASSHLGTVNTALMQKAGITAETETEGVVKGPDGEPIGELQEKPAMFLSGNLGFLKIAANLGSEQTIWNYGNVSQIAGCTTLAELGSVTAFNPQTVDLWKRVVNDPSYPVRVTVAYSQLLGGPSDPNEVAQLVRQLEAQQSSDKLRFGLVKLFTDGSIQGFTARLKWPGYFNGAPNGIWMTAPEQFEDIVLAIHKAGLTIHCHCNGDEATEVFIDAVERAQRQAPQPDHRHTVTHCQMTSAAQYRRMAKLGMCANIFSNHIFYWGDQHYEITIGPERAERMDACATAKREGVPFSMHADAPVTPTGNLHSAWCAVNRLTASGRVLGEEERISVYDALHAVTMGSAYQLNLDDELGSIEVGKWADFAVLDEDPFAVDPVALKDIPVWGTVLGGQPFPAAGQ